ncbi:MAG: hypothetical protein AOA65_1957 [Candidatus Bathyarchaeota archaeon BA1]|nr:MAG: hypothetical protein AOA65_1957 [Candidatus Bathyarchaeota archaeon BA1]
MVNALADLLPGVEVVAGCVFNCSPRDPTNMCDECRGRLERGQNLPIEKRKMRVITLPLGATEDRVIGTLDIEKAIREGIRALEPGLLAEVNQNILYVDEINLLPDHIVDDILDAASSGWNVVEREAVSVAHPSRFILIGTMNPEEGELRPQILDRLALHIAVTGIFEKEARVEIIKKNLEFDEDPLGFRKLYEKQQRELRERIVMAQEALNRVVIPEAILDAVARACISLTVDGHRPDIIILRAAKTLAAFEGREEVTPEDILKVAEMALSHRTRRGGFDEPASPGEIRRVFNEAIEASYKERGVTAATQLRT